MTIRNLKSLFQPRSVALVGEIDEPLSAGALTAGNLIGGGFGGDIFFVNSQGRAIEGYPPFTAVDALPAAPDLAVISSAPAAVSGVIADLGRLGTRAAAVISTGFVEYDRQSSRALQAEILTAAGPHLLRVIGPNSTGVMAPRHGLNAGFTHLQPLPGALAFVTQSNAVLASVLDWATHRRIGFSHCVCLGDMIDVDFGDMLDYLAGDHHCRAILLYMEHITQARKFMSAARAAARIKPVIVVKAGRYSGERIPDPGAAAGVFDTDAVYEAAFARAGVLRVNDLQALFDAVTTLGLLQPVHDNRLAVLTNGRGLGLLAADALIDKHGRLARLDAATIERLSAVLPSTWSRMNPVDIRPDAQAARYKAALEILSENTGVDAVLVLNAPSAAASRREIAEAVIQTAAAQAGRWNRCGILTCWLGDGATQALRQLFIEKGVPSYETPAEAVRGFMQMYRYRHGQELLMETPPSIPGDFRPDTDEARKLIKTARDQNQEWLTAAQTMALLKAYRIPVAEAHFAADPEAAARMTTELGGPVILKLSVPRPPTASAGESQALDHDDPELVRETAAAMLEQVRDETPDIHPDGFILQPLIDRTGRYELCLGMLTDAVFGPLLYFGQGGKAAQVIGDQALALPPLNMKLAHETITRTRIFRLLAGISGIPAVDNEAVAFTLVKLAQLISDLSEIAAIDINPLLAGPCGVIVLDAVCRIRKPQAAALRRLAICAYPTELEETITLPDGRNMLLRPVRPEDEPAYQDVFSSLSAEAIRFRFLHSKKILPHIEAARLTQIDYDREMALVLAGRNPSGKPELYGSVRVMADPDNEDAEFAILLRGDMIGMGLGPMLMRRIIDYARRRGIRRLHGDVLDDNRPMLQVCKALGFKQKRDLDDPGVVRVGLELEVG